MVAGATASTRQKLSVLTSSSSDTSDNNAAGGHRTTDHPSQNGASAIKEAGNLHCVQFFLNMSKIYSVYNNT